MENGVLGGRQVVWFVESRDNATWFIVLLLTRRTG